MTKTILLVAATGAAAIAAAVPALAAPSAQTVRVTERDYRIGLSTAPKAGRVTFVVRNTGDDAHDFRVSGRGVSKRSPTLAPGRSVRLTVTLKKGARYRFWCAVGSHAKKGMSGSFVAR
jgi:uncharacterized cupredoxin-like copper-binding protein